MPAPHAGPSALEDLVLPELAAARLRSGARVAQAGCGEGATLIALAVRFPRSSFHGFDVEGSSISAARIAGARAGVSDRVTFEVAHPAGIRGDRFDLVFTSERSRPDDARIRSVLADDGLWLHAEAAGASFEIRS